MDPELKALLEENVRLARENNELLLTMNRRARWSLIGKVVLWILVIIVPIFFIQSFLAPYTALLQSDTGSQNQESILQQYQDLLK